MFQSAVAQVVPANRTIDWSQAGVPGGIPTNRTVFTNVSGLDTNGILDCSAAIQAAINACPSNGIVMLPAGTLVLSNSLNIAANTLRLRPGNITLRGAGNTNTLIICRTGGGVIGTGNENYGRSNNIMVSTMLQGASNLTVTGTPDFLVGDLLLLRRQDETATNFVLVFNNNGLTNSDIVYTNGALSGLGNWGRIGSGDVFAQLVTCTGVRGGSIAFWPPLYLSWTNPPGLYAYCEKVWGASAGVGIESLAITNASGNNNSMVNFSGCSDSWLSGCKLSGYGSPVVMLNECANCEVRDSDFNLASNRTSGDIFALELNGSCACKVENNTFSGYANQLILESSASGNVISYNYFTNEWWYPAATTSYLEPDIMLCHEAFDAMNLLEGNILSGLQADNYHGGSGYNTLYRNWVHGMDCPYGVPLTNNVKCVDLDRYSYYCNVVGNVIGSAFVASVPGSVYEAPTNGFNTGMNAMYRLGFPDMGNDYSQVNDALIFYQGAAGTSVMGYPIGYDTKVTATLLRKDNYDYVTGGVPDGITSLPASLVYGANPPAWWPSALAWPAIGPDVTPITGVIPAEIRYYNSSAAFPKVPGATNSTNSLSQASIPAPTGLRIVASDGSSGTNSATIRAGAYSPAADTNVFEWLKADAINQGNNTAVATWPASIGASLVNPNSGMTQPIFKTAQQNGLPAVLFNGANSTYLATPANFASQSQPFTIFIVFKDRDSTGSIPIGPAGGGSDFRWIRQAYGVYDISAGGAGSGPVEPVTDNNWHILMLVFNGLNSKWRQDGGAVTAFSSSPGPNPINSISLGAYQSNLANATITCGEVIFYSGDQSVNAATIFDYLDGRWGVY
jgi:hypothetical protein